MTFSDFSSGFIIDLQYSSCVSHDILFSRSIDFLEYIAIANTTHRQSLLCENAVKLVSDTLLKLALFFIGEYSALLYVARVSALVSICFIHYNHSPDYII